MESASALSLGMQRGSSGESSPAVSFDLGQESDFQAATFAIFVDLRSAAEFVAGLPRVAR